MSTWEERMTQRAAIRRRSTLAEKRATLSDSPCACPGPTFTDDADFPNHCQACLGRLDVRFGTVAFWGSWESSI